MDSESATTAAAYVNNPLESRSMDDDSTSAVDSSEEEDSIFADNEEEKYGETEKKLLSAIRENPFLPCARLLPNEIPPFHEMPNQPKRLARRWKDTLDQFEDPTYLPHLESKAPLLVLGSLEEEEEEEDGEMQERSKTGSFVVPNLLETSGKRFASDNNTEKTTKPTKNYDPTKMARFQFDEKRMFFPPSFEPHVEEEAFQRILKAIEEPLQELEKDGYEAYRRYIDGENKENKGDGAYRMNGRKRKRNEEPWKRPSTMSNTEESKEADIRNNLQDALIHGDPREYQRKFFQAAKKRNTIVNLGTGAGKTMIALLLIREMWSQKAFKETRKEPSSPEIPMERSNEASQRKKQTLFLVPSIALALQQSLTIEANLPHLKVETACYRNATGGSRKAKPALARSDVIVATHGAIHDLLMHYGDTFSMERFNLVVIDECHYAASGNHTFRRLMDRFYHPLPLEKRPKILGLTASPLLNVKEHYTDEQLAGMIDHLEKVLDSKMMSATRFIDHADESTQQSTENNLLRRVIDERELTFHGTNKHRSVPSAANLDLLPSRHREFKQLEQLYKDLGPLVVSIYCCVLLKELSKNVFENETNERFQCTLNHIQRIKVFCDQEIKLLPNMGRTDKLLALEEIIEGLIEENGNTTTIGLVFVQRRITAIALHVYFIWRKKQMERSIVGSKGQKWKSAKEARRERQKLDQLFELRCSETDFTQGSDDSNEIDDRFDDSMDDPFRKFQKRHGPTDTPEASLQHQIKAAETPDDSQFMDAPDVSNDESCDSEERDNKKRKYGRVSVKSVALVRKPNEIFKSLSLHRQSIDDFDSNDWVHREQNIRDTLSRLRKGETNLMFATSVVEEGVDVQACSFVVAFDDITSIKAYIQMKGRARNRDSKFFAFRDDTSEIKLKLSVAQEMESRIDRVIDRRMGAYSATIDDFSSPVKVTERTHTLTYSKEIEALETGVYKVGGATVDIQTAKSLLNRYFTSVPLDPFVRSKKESLLAYMPCFETNRLLLPVHLPSDFRIVTLPDKYNKCPRREKEKMLSLIACVRLHSHGLLNERLLPLTRNDLQTYLIRAATETGDKIDTPPLDIKDFFLDGQRQLLIYTVKEKSSLLSGYRKTLMGGGHSLAIITTRPIQTMESPISFKHPQFGEVSVSIKEQSRVFCSNDEFITLREMFVLLFNSRWSRKSRNLFFEARKKEEYKSVIMPYLVGIVSATGELDWKFMKMLIEESQRSLEERSHIAKSASGKTLTQPRMCFTSYNVRARYVVSGPSGRTCGEPAKFSTDDIKNHVEYFKKAHSIDVADECPLYHCYIKWSQPNGMSSKEYIAKRGEMFPSSLSFEFCEIPYHLLVEETLANAYIDSLCLFLPQILFVFEQRQNTEAFIRHCEMNFPTLGCSLKTMDFDKVALSMTSRRCNPDENYESLEWLGDAVLKLLQTDSILRSNAVKHLVQLLHEGDLSILRSAMGTNDRLQEICTQLALEDFIMMTPLARGKWAPSLLKACGTSLSDAPMGDMKVFADIIESLLGMIYLEFGYRTAIKVGNELRVTLQWDETHENVASGESGGEEDAVLVSMIQKCTGHRTRFRRPRLMLEAFTHPTVSDATVPSYQRLEWIGDAVICLCTREWLYRNLNDCTNLGNLVTLEAAFVSNETLGFLSVKHGLQQHLNHRDQALPKRIESYCHNVQDGCGFWGGDPPKPIADVVEAMLGAIHVDSGFESGQKAALQFLSSVFSVFKESSTVGVDKKNLDDLLDRFKHPKKVIQEMTGLLFSISTCTENDFASKNHFRYHRSLDDKDHAEKKSLFQIPQVLQKNEWRNLCVGGHESCYVSCVSILGHPLIAVADVSKNAASNKAASLARYVLERNHELKQRIAKYRSEIEVGIEIESKRRKMLGTP